MAYEVNDWPRGSDANRVELITRGRQAPTGDRPRMVLDTDTFNEIDDQYALVHAILSADTVRLEAVYAAPFHNEKSEGPGDGMRKSYMEIERVLERCGRSGLPVFEGAEAWLESARDGEVSAATRDLIERARAAGDGPLYVVAIGAPTNVSAALIAAPEVIERIVVVWLGGNALWWPTAEEFNLRQDITASRALLDSGVALVHVPCRGVADYLATSRDEIEHYVRNAGRIGDFLADRFADYVLETPGITKVIWDMAAVGWLLSSSWTTTVLTHSPVLTNEMTWSKDKRRHLIGEVIALDRDAIFGDFFARLGAAFAVPR